MKITRHGANSFLIQGEDVSIALNPYKGTSAMKAEIVIKTSELDTEKVEGELRTFSWPGEYEMKDVPIMGFSTKTDESDSQNVVFYFKIDGVRFCHLGELSSKISNEVVNQIGDIDILLVDLGKESMFNVKKTLEMVEDIDPRIVIPMGKGSLNEALKEFGVESFEMEDSFSFKSASALPKDKREYKVLAVA